MSLSAVDLSSPPACLAFILILSHAFCFSSLFAYLPQPPSSVSINDFNGLVGIFFLFLFRIFLSFFPNWQKLFRFPLPTRVKNRSNNLPKGKGSKRHIYSS